MTDHAPLSARRVALLVEEDFEDRELPLLLELLRAEGLTVTVIGPVADAVYRGKRQEATITSELAASKARVKDFDIVIVPGGYAPDRIRLRHAMVDLVRDAVEAGKPVAAIDHGPSVLINARALGGRMITCWPSIAVDAKNAGARYVDRPVVEDGCIITSRKSDDLPFFTEAIIRQLLAKLV